jgi:hypothetical protein
MHHSHDKEARNSQHLRGGIGSGEMKLDEGRSMESSESRVVGMDDSNREIQEVDEDRVARKMYDAVS